MSKKVAVVLSGCGFLDGAEIRESVLSLLTLDQNNTEYDIFAPDLDQYHTINHLKSEEVSTKRNILEEASRIARGKIKPLRDLNPNDYQALVIPGGFGVAKNLCDFAFKGSGAEVLPAMKEIVISFHTNKKPIAAICIAPALIALCLGDKQVEVTIGTDIETASEIEKTGAKHINKDVHEFHTDETNLITSTPAYMFDSAGLDQIQIGIKGCIEKALSF